MSSPNPVAVRLSEKGIKRVLIVDDAFDPLRRSDLTHNELAEFWYDLELDSPEQCAMLVKLLGIIPASEEEIDDAGLAALYEQRDKLGPLQVAFDTHLKSPLRIKHGHLDPLVEELRALGLKVVEIGTIEQVDPGHAQIIFLDHYLGDPGVDASVEAARASVKKLLNLYPVGSEKPLVVLMSSDGDVKTLAENFRSQTGIIGGMFYFLPKSDLTDRVKLLLDLDMLAMALPDGHRIQKFIDTVETKIDGVVFQFLTDVKRLSIDDYVYIQRLSLQADGHPLGDYLLWLYSAFFGHLLFENALGAERRELDRLTFEDWVPSQILPSTQLTAMYNAALFDTTLGPLGPHPRWEKPAKEGMPPLEQSGAAFGQGELLATPQEVAGNVLEDSKSAEDQEDYNGHTEVPSPTNDDSVEVSKALPYFNMGDIFLNSDLSEVLMVCNPACDLEFAPDDKRLPNSKDSIMFIPGVLEKLGEPSGKPTLRTELFKYGEESYRILWQAKQLRAIPYEKVKKWLSKREFARVARLRMPFSLEIQHYFANQLTRVGVPVPPPFYRPLQVAIYKRGTDGNHGELTIADSEKGAFVISTSNGEEKCVLTASLVRALQRGVDEISNEGLLPLDGELDETELKRRQRANKRIEMAKGSGRDFLAWRQVSELFAVPNKGAIRKFDRAGVAVGRDIPAAGPWSNDALLLVHITESQPLVELPGPPA